MNQRETSGLPLRAIVMVLLFLGVVFLLVGFQSMGSDDDAADSTSSSVVSTVTPAPSTSASASGQAAPRAEVRVFNVSDVAGAAETVANRLRDDEWNVVETGNLPPEGVTATTVYWGEAAGERQSAEQIGKLLDAPVAERTPPLADRPPGVIVVVTG